MVETILIIRKRFRICGLSRKDELNVNEASLLEVVEVEVMVSA